MKSKLIIEIETPNPEDLMISYEESYDEDGEIDEKKEIEANKLFATDLHKYALSHINYFLKNNYEDDFLDNLEELSIENWDTLEDYGVKIFVKEVNNNGD